MSLRFVSYERLLCTVVTMCVAGCGDGPKGGTDVGNGRTIVSLNADGYASGAQGLAGPAPQAKALELSGGVRVDKLLISLDRIRLRPGADCSADEETPKLDVEGPLVADLAATGFLSGPVSFETDAGAFCELSYGIHKFDDVAGVPELANLSIYIEGVRSDGVAFIIESEADREFKLRATSPDGFSLPEGNASVVLGFQVDAWLTALDLDNLNGNPIVINESSNDEALDAFEDAIEDASKLFEDGDGSGELDDDELDDELASSP